MKLTTLVPTFIASLLLAQTAAASPRVYVLASVGLSTADVNHSGLLSRDTNDGVYALGLGVTLNKYVALEARYLNTGAYTGTYSSARVDMKNAGYSAGVLGMLPLTNSVSVYGRVEGINMRTRLTVSDAGRTGSRSDTNMSLGLGTGVQVALGQGFAMRAQFERIALDTDDIGLKDGDAHINIYSLGLIKSF